MKTCVRTFLITFRSILLLMRNVPDKIFRENRNTHLMLKNFFFDNRTFYEIIPKNIVAPAWPQMTVWRMRISRWVPKATDTHTHTHTQYVILIAFLLQQWLHGRASMLNYTYIVCLVIFLLHNTLVLLYCFREELRAFFCLT
jgi:hypothetical protein